MSSLDLGQNKIESLYSNTIKGHFSRLVLDDNLIKKSSFETNSFGHLPVLREISFSKNLIEQLNFQHAFEFNMTRVETLNFKHNKIDSLAESSKFFAVFPRLTFLELSFNSLYLLKRNFLLCLRNLKHLLLGNNKILTIERATFEHLNELVHLDLSNNLVYDLSQSLFVKLSNLLSLDLSGNKIEYLDRETFKGLGSSLSSLDLSSNAAIRPLSSDVLCDFRRITLLKLGSTENSDLASLCECVTSIEHLDVSNTMLKSFAFAFENVSFLDLSHNPLLESFTLTRSVRVLNLSNTNSRLILRLNLTVESSLEVLDLSLNNLTFLRDDFFFSRLVHLKSLNLSNTKLLQFEFLNKLHIQLLKLDLSNNPMFGAEYYKYANVLQLITFLHASNVGLSTFSANSDQFEHLDLSSNNLKVFNYISKKIVNLNLRNNRIDTLFGNEIEMKKFMDSYVSLRRIDLSNTLSQLLENVILYFNKGLEVGLLAGNGLRVFPKFCQFYALLLSRDRNSECSLRELNIDSNRLARIAFVDLMDLNKLEYLSLENNSISLCEGNSFSNLIKLETLILSLNRLHSLTDISLFAHLTNLKLLNLSSNLLELVPAHLFSNLLKLETLDLSSNRIRFVATYALHKLSNLRNLHLNDNDPGLEFESNDTFVSCDAIQNIYVSSSLFRAESNVRIVLNLFEERKKMIEKVVLGRRFFKSLFLISNYSKYDCEMTLFFIERNVHFNFKSETNIFDYFSECSLASIKNESLVKDTSMSRQMLIFNQLGIYFFYSILASIVASAFYFLVRVYAETQDATPFIVRVNQ